MCGVIVVDTGRSRSTCLGLDAYIHDHCLGYRHDYLLFYQLPNSYLFTHRMVFSREKPLVKTMAPGPLYHILKILKIPCYNFTLYILFYIFCPTYLSITIQFSLAINRQGIDNPLFALGARICYFVCRCC